MIVASAKSEALAIFPLILVFCFFTLVFSLALLSFITVSLLLPGPVMVAQRLLYVSPVVFGGTRLSGPGFILPAVLAAASSLHLRQSHALGQRAGLGRGWRLLAGATAVSVVLSLFLPRELLFRSFGGTDPILALSLLLFLSYLVWRGEARLAVRLAFPLGFMLGLVSDLESLRFIYEGVFGGNGFFDGDFMEPVAMFFSALVAGRFFGALRKARGHVTTTGA